MSMDIHMSWDPVSFNPLKNDTNATRYYWEVGPDGYVVPTIPVSDNHTWDRSIERAQYFIALCISAGVSVCLSALQGDVCMWWIWLCVARSRHHSPPYILTLVSHLMADSASLACQRSSLTLLFQCWNYKWGAPWLPFIYVSTRDLIMTVGISQAAFLKPVLPKVLLSATYWGIR